MSHSPLLIHLLERRFNCRSALFQLSLDPCTHSFSTSLIAFAILLAGHVQIFLPHFRNSCDWLVRVAVGGKMLITISRTCRMHGSLIIHCIEGSRECRSAQRI